jgi:threonyl-tRNA synthetase
MYKVLDPEGEEFYLKPMNCPHHHMIYQELVKSYRDLPLRLAEAGPVYRVEKSGETYGLMRVRGPITQNDAHIYTTEENLGEEFIRVLELLLEVYQDIEVIKNFWFRLSLPDFTGKNKEKYGGDLKLWQWASKTIKSACQKKKLSLKEGIGEAAFYGPKLDMQIENIYGKEETIATIQVDVLVPKRMNLVYVDKNNKEKNPIIIHRAILGSYERFIGFLLEQTKGDLPLWLSPIQALILPIKKEHQNYAEEINNILKEKNFRSEIWPAEETLAKRILLAEEEKIPMVLVVGDREIKNKTCSLRLRHQGDLGERKIEEIIKILNEKGNIPN